MFVRKGGESDMKKYCLATVGIIEKEIIKNREISRKITWRYAAWADTWMGDCSCFDVEAVN